MQWMSRETIPCSADWAPDRRCACSLHAGVRLARLNKHLRSQALHPFCSAVDGCRGHCSYDPAACCRANAPVGPICLPAIRLHRQRIHRHPQRLVRSLVSVCTCESHSKFLLAWRGLIFVYLLDVLLSARELHHLLLRVF